MAKFNAELQPSVYPFPKKIHEIKSWTLAGQDAKNLSLMPNNLETSPKIRPVQIIKKICQKLDDKLLCGEVDMGLQLFWFKKKNTQSVLTASIKRKQKYLRNLSSNSEIDSFTSITHQQDPKTVKQSKCMLKNTICVE